MAINKLMFNGFLGITSGLDPRLIGIPYAADALNVAGSDSGVINPRLGLKKLSAGIPTNFTTSYGAYFTGSYDSNYINQQGYVSVEKITPATVLTIVASGTTSITQTLGSTTGIVQGDIIHFATANVDRTVASVTNSTVLVLTSSVTSTTNEVVNLQPRVNAFSINKSTGARTELKNGTSHIPLNASDWRWFTHYFYVFGVNPNDTNSPIIRYTLGTSNTLTQIKTPADPTTTEAYSIILPNVSTYPAGYQGYPRLLWTNINVISDITYSGIAVGSKSGQLTSVTSSTQVNDTSLGVNSNDLQTLKTPLTITMTSGSANGQIRTISSNTSTQITVSAAFSPSPTTGDTYRINLSCVDDNGGGGVLINMEGDFSSSHTGAATFSIDMTNISGMGIQDWRDNDRFQLIIYPYVVNNGVNGYAQFDNTSWTFSVTTQAGNIYTPTVVRDTLSWAVNGFTALANVFTLEFDNKQTRSDWATAKSIKVGVTLTNNGQIGPRSTRIAVLPLTVGGVNMLPISVAPATRIYTSSTLRFGYTYYNSTTALESGVAGLKDVLFNDLQGTSTGFSAAPTKLGANLTLSAPISADSLVDYVRFYVQDDQDIWRYIGQVANTGSPSIEYYYTFNEIKAFPQFVSSPFSYNKAMAGIPFRGWIVWIFQGGGGPGQPNVRHSGVGTPLRLYNAANDQNSADASRPADYSLSDGFSDQPLNAYQADDVLIITGSEGIYAQTAGNAIFANNQGGFGSIGFSPSTMSPPKKLPSSKGCAGTNASCRFHDELGNPGVAYMTTDGEVWFALVSNQFDGTIGHRIDWISKGIKGLPKSWLLDGQSLTNYSTCLLGADEMTDALWVIMGARALVLRRASLADNARQWEKYSYNLGTGITFKSIMFSPTQKLRAALSDGRIIDMEYDSTNSYAPIAGTNIDDGLPMPEGYWQSKTFNDERINKRAMKWNVIRDDMTQAVYCTVYTTFLPSGYLSTILAQTRSGRFPASATGEESYYKIKVVENQTTIHDMQIEEFSASDRNKI